jgi:hypothetical protein
LKRIKILKFEEGTRMEDKGNVIKLLGFDGKSSNFTCW